MVTCTCYSVLPVQTEVKTTWYQAHLARQQMWRMEAQRGSDILCHALVILTRHWFGKHQYLFLKM